jgi:hypothetical protein
MGFADCCKRLGHRNLPRSSTGQTVFERRGEAFSVFGFSGKMITPDTSVSGKASTAWQLNLLWDNGLNDQTAAFGHRSLNRYPGVGAGQDAKEFGFKAGVR